MLIMKIPYSAQAQLLLSQMPEFPKKEFEDWFLQNLSIGSANILMFLEHITKK